MPNLLRWARIAVDEDHEDLMQYTFSILHQFGYQPPGEFKEYLPDILDLMFHSEKCKELASKLFSLQYSAKMKPCIRPIHMMLVFIWSRVLLLGQKPIHNSGLTLAQNLL